MTVTDTRPATTATDAARDDHDRILYVDPTTLEIGLNVRLDPRIDRGFIESVRERGVLEAISAYYNAEGVLTVERGQRRTLAAIKTGRPTVPVRVVAAPARTADRIIDQLTENEHRLAMLRGETALAYQQLSLDCGMTAGQIAKQTGRKKDDVARQLTVAKSELARRAADRYALNLLQAATVAEFDDDPETVKALIAAARTGQFEHVAQQARDRRSWEARRVTLAAECAAAGIAVVEWPLSTPERTLASLGIRDEDAEQHRAMCDGHAVALSERQGENGRVWAVVPVCVDPITNGHTTPAAAQAPAEETAPVQLTEEERAAKALAAARDREWDSAVTVRREWLATLAKRRTAPTGAEGFIASALLTWDAPIRRALDSNHALLREILGMSDQDADAARAALADQASNGAAKRATVVALVTLLAAWEARTTRKTWRAPTATDRAVMTALVTWGYGPSDVETLLMLDPEDDAPAADAAADAAPVTEQDAAQDDAPAAVEQDDAAPTFATVRPALRVLPAQDAPAEEDAAPLDDSEAGALAALDDATATE